jgi:hypothetical protein
VCCNCADWIDLCFPCGRTDPATGKQRARHFWVDGGPVCEHVAAKHDPACPARLGGYCTYQGACDPDPDEEPVSGG